MSVRAHSAMLAAVALLAIVPREAAAEVYRPWCVGYTATISNSCTFVSFEQCMETARGGGGSCMQNPWYLYYGERQPALASTGERARRRR
jgi:hypothetical protein